MQVFASFWKKSLQTIKKVLIFFTYLFTLIYSERSSRRCRTTNITRPMYSYNLTDQCKRVLCQKFKVLNIIVRKTDQYVLSIRYCKYHRTLTGRVDVKRNIVNISNIHGNLIKNTSISQIHTDSDINQFTTVTKVSKFYLDDWIETVKKKAMQNWNST